MSPLLPSLPLANSGLFETAVFGAVVSLGLASIMIGTAAWLTSRFLVTATWRKIVWQLALVSMTVLVIAETTGINGSCGDWLRTLAASVDQGDTVPAPARDTSSSRDSDTNPSLAPAVNREPPRLEDLSGSLPPGQFFGAVGDSNGTLPAADLGEADQYLTSSAGGSPWAAGAAGPSAEPPLPLVESSLDSREASSARTTWFGFAWIVVGLAFLGRSLGGRVLLWQFARKLESNQNSNLARMAVDIARRLKCRRSPEIKLSSKLAGPLAFGIFRPTMALPANFRRQFTPEGQRAVLAHEIAHLRHHDPFWLLVADLLTSLLWWNPVIWLMRARLKHESELVADEATLCLEDGPAHLASSLLRLGSRLARPRAMGFVSANGSGLKSNLGQRIERLMNLDGDTCRPRRTRPFLRTLAVACVIAGCLIGTAWARPGLPSGGDSNVNSFQRNWRTSFAGAALAALLVGVPTQADAQDDAPPKPGDVQAGSDAKADAKAQDDEIKMLEAEMANLLTLKADLAASFSETSDRARAELKTQRNQLAAEAREIQAQMDQLAQRLAQAEEAGEKEIAQQAARQLEAMQARLAQRNSDIEALQAEVSQRVNRRFAADQAGLESRFADFASRLEQIRASGDLEAAKRLQDRFAMLQRQAAQSRRRATQRDDGEPAANARRRRPDEPQGDATRRRRPADSDDVEAQIRHILAAAENLEAAGMHEQARELREMIRRRMGPPGTGQAGSQPPRRRPPTSDAPATDRPRRGRVGPGADAPPRDAPRRGRAGLRADAPPRDAPTGRRGDDGAVDRELLNLIRSLQREVNSLRTEVETLRREVGRGGDRLRRRDTKGEPPSGGRRRADREQPDAVDGPPETLDSPPDPQKITRR